MNALSFERDYSCHITVECTNKVRRIDENGHLRQKSNRVCAVTVFNGIVGSVLRL